MRSDQAKRRMKLGTHRARVGGVGDSVSHEDQGGLEEIVD